MERLRSEPAFYPISDPVLDKGSILLAARFGLVPLQIILRE